VNEGANTHTLLLAGFFRGSHKTLIRARLAFQLGSGVTMQLGVVCLSYTQGMIWTARFVLSDRILDMYIDLISPGIILKAKELVNKGPKSELLNFQLGELRTQRTMDPGLWTLDSGEWRTEDDSESLRLSLSVSDSLTVLRPFYFLGRIHICIVMVIMKGVCGLWTVDVEAGAAGRTRGRHQRPVKSDFQCCQWSGQCGYGISKCMPRNCCEDKPKPAVSSSTETATVTVTATGSIPKSTPPLMPTSTFACGITIDVAYFGNYVCNATANEIVNFPEE
ncbi:hypothetical protein SARC_13222, partial [Sphaeroforma arctica JP610]